MAESALIPLSKVKAVANYICCSRKPLECSWENEDGLIEVFEEAVRAALNPTKQDRKRQNEAAGLSA